MGTYLGFDHHKRWTQAVATDERGLILREARVANDRPTLAGFLKDLPKPWKGVVEAGPTWGWIFDTLEGLGVEMIVAHPLKVRAIAEAKIKTDSIDARMLAHLLRTDLIPRVYVPGKGTRERKMIWRERIWLVRSAARLKNRIHQLLAHHHVELPELSDLFGVNGRKFLRDVALPTTARRMLDAELKLLETYREQIKDIQAWAIEMTRETESLRYLESLPGLGEILAPIVALEIDDINRFSDPGKLASYCGLVPSLYSSGGKFRQGGVGKQGNHWLKWAFIEAAWVAMRTSPYFKLYYHRVRQKKLAQVAITATARRLSEVAFHLLKQRRMYEERSPAYA